MREYKIMLSQLINIYGMLLQIPPNEEWRIRNQDIYAKLRDDIALLSGVDAENVQNFCEAASRLARGK
jgi:hypothetical protein